MRSRLRRGKVGRVNTALLSNQAGLIVALRVCPHTKQWQLLLCAHTHYSPLCWPGSHRSSHNSPWMVPGSLLVLARHPFPRGSVTEEKASSHGKPTHAAVRAHLRVTGRRVVGGRRGVARTEHTWTPIHMQICLTLTKKTL